ncbi:MAG: hypothetical protein AMJ45_02285 [Syntrophobacter sp. DG_60]|nr:MAG: hypothetical protein AMJ45_02285 [Syntrophobacter sp. DG_60]
MFKNIETLSIVFVFLAASGVVALSYVKFQTFIGLERVFLGFFVLACKGLISTEHTFMISSLGYVLLLWGFFRIHKNFRKLKERSYIDPVIQVYNRLFFDELIAQLTNKASKIRHSFAFIMIDLDNLKKVSDFCGFEEGDKILFKIVNILRQNIGQKDILCRYADDRFVIYAPEMDEKGVLNLASRLEPIKITLGKFIIRLNIGYAIFPDDGREIKKLVPIADKRMYLDKKSKAFLSQ